MTKEKGIAIGCGIAFVIFSFTYTYQTNPGLLQQYVDSFLKAAENAMIGLNIVGAIFAGFINGAVIFFTNLF